MNINKSREFFQTDNCPADYFQCKHNHLQTRELMAVFKIYNRLFSERVV